jgi:hypothetical protein
LSHRRGNLPWEKGGSARVGPVSGRAGPDRARPY